jgi:hypothetical protein
MKTKEKKGKGKKGMSSVLNGAFDSFITTDKVSE